MGRRSQEPATTGAESKASRKQISLDEIDHRILRELQMNNQLTNLELAKRVRISPPACLRRLRRIRAGGVILADVSILNRAAFGRFVTCVVGVTLDRERADVVDGFKRVIRAESAVSQCYVVTGESDFVLIVHVPHVEDYEMLTQRLFYNNPHIAKFTTMVSIGTVKFDNTIPILA